MNKATREETGQAAKGTKRKSAGKIIETILLSTNRG